MKQIAKGLIVTLGVTLFFCSSSSIAEDYDLNGINFNLRQDDLDSYWHDTSIWAFYGYRPHTNAHISRFMPSLPYYANAGRGPSSFGYDMNMPMPDESTYTPSLRKTQIQMTKYGTWH